MTTPAPQRPQPRDPQAPETPQTPRPPSAPAGATARRPHAALATALLVAVTAVWGSTFVLIHGIVDTLLPVDFLAVRFQLAAVCMLAVFARQVRALTRRDWAIGVGLGVVYSAAQVLQTVGLVTTAPARSGFLTALYVVLTPLLGAALLRERVPRTTVAAVVLALTGVAVLTLGRGATSGWGTGDTLTALVYAVHIVGLGRWSRPQAATGIATVQILTLAVCITLAALPGGIALPHGGGQWAVVGYMALVAGAGAMWAQTWAQAHMPAARAAVVMTCEPVFAAACSVLAGADPLTVRLVVGGALVLTAMYVVELASPASAT